MRILSWNVNGLRAVYKKGFAESVARMDPDVLCLQETKLQEDQRSEEMTSLGPYHSYWDYASTRKGYSGVAVYARKMPEASRCGFGIERFDVEGRVIELDYDRFVLFNIYFPNGQKDDERLQYKLDFYRDFFAYADELKARGRSLIITGDFNTAHNEIDLKNPNFVLSGYFNLK